MSALVQPQETNPEKPDVGIFGQNVDLPAPRTAVQKVGDEIRSTLRRLQERQNEELGRRHKGVEYSLQPISQLELNFRHSFWQNDREKVQRAFMELTLSRSRQERFACCGSAARVQVSTDGQDARVVSNKCHDRFCKACGGERQRLITQNVLTFCTGKALRFITLTLKHNNERLERQITRLYACLNRLRERRSWKDRVHGGAVFMEFKPAKDRDEWHPHLHLIVESDFFPQSLLSSEWLAVTGDSSIVDIRYVYDQTTAISYVAKYAAKPLDGALFHRPEMLKEAILALQGRRACTTFGTWRGLKLEEVPEDTREWKDVGTIEDVRRRAMQGSIADIALVERLNLDGDSPPPQKAKPPPDS